MEQKTSAPAWGMWNESDSIGEENDCAVIAFAIARGVTYERSHIIHSVIRKKGEPVDRCECITLWEGYGLFRMPLGNISTPLSVILQNEEFKKRTFVCWVPHHVFAVVDGTPQDRYLISGEIPFNDVYVESVGFFL